MIILGIDTSTQICTVALMKNMDLLAEYTLNVKKTHSQRLLPLVDSLFRDTGIDIGELNAIAVAAGPGSFTGIRIGVATARGMAQGLNIPSIGVSTLDALAENFIPGSSEMICPLLDARRNEVYTALYRCSETLLEPSVMTLTSLIEILHRFTEKVYFPGDGLSKYGEFLHKEMGKRFGEINNSQSFNSASAVIRCAIKKINSNLDDYSPYSLVPMYVRLPEAERIAISQNL